MRATMLAVFTLAAFAIQANGALAQADRTPSELADDSLAAVLWRIAVSTDTPIGFQSIEPLTVTQGDLRNVLFPGGPPEVRRIVVPSFEDALTAALAANPRYEWRRVGSVVVVRPTGAWSDGHDPLNAAVRNVRVERSTDIEILAGIASLIHTGRYVEHRGEGRTVVPPFSVESGTIVDVLNALIQSAQLPFWQAGYRPHPPGERRTRVDLSLIVATATGLPTQTGSHIPAPVQARRGAN